jgi:hypothetical protein
MCRASKTLAIAALSAALMLVGCSEDATGPSDTDREQIRSLLADHPAIFDPTVLYEDDSPIWGAPSLPNFGGANEVRWFWREMTSMDSSYTITIHDSDSADVTVAYEIMGTFHVLIEREADTTEVSREINDICHQLAKVMKTDTTDEYGGWCVTGLSGVKLLSLSVPPPIDSLHISSEGVDTTVTDVMKLFSPDSFPFSFAPQESVTVRVIPQTTNIGEIRAILHVPWMDDPADRKLHMEYGGPTAFVKSYQTPADGGWYCAFVDLIHYNSIWGGEEQPYRARMWGVLYKVKEE